MDIFDAGFENRLTRSSFKVLHEKKYIGYRDENDIAETSHDSIGEYLDSLEEKTKIRVNIVYNYSIYGNCFNSIEDFNNFGKKVVAINDELFGDLLVTLRVEDANNTPMKLLTMGHTVFTGFYTAEGITKNDIGESEYYNADDQKRNVRFSVILNGFIDKSEYENMLETMEYIF